jgi:hypothetical protein
MTSLNDRFHDPLPLPPTEGEDCDGTVARSPLGVGRVSVSIRLCKTRRESEASSAGSVNNNAGAQDHWRRAWEHGIGRTFGGEALASITCSVVSVDSL